MAKFLMLKYLILELYSTSAFPMTTYFMLLSLMKLSLGSKGLPLICECGGCRSSWPCLFSSWLTNSTRLFEFRLSVKHREQNQLWFSQNNRCLAYLTFSPKDNELNYQTKELYQSFYLSPDLLAALVFATEHNTADKIFPVFASLLLCIYSQTVWMSLLFVSKSPAEILCRTHYDFKTKSEWTALHLNLAYNRISTFS